MPVPTIAQLFSFSPFKNLQTLLQLHKMKEWGRLGNEKGGFSLLSPRLHKGTSGQSLSLSPVKSHFVPGSLLLVYFSSLKSSHFQANASKEGKQISTDFLWQLSHMALIRKINELAGIQTCSLTDLFLETRKVFLAGFLASPSIKISAWRTSFSTDSSTSRALRPPPDIDSFAF